MDVEGLLFTYKQQLNPQKNILEFILEFVTPKGEEIIATMTHNMRIIQALIMAVSTIAYAGVAIRKLEALQQVSRLSQTIYRGEMTDNLERQLTIANRHLASVKIEQKQLTQVLWTTGCSIVGSFVGAHVHRVGALRGGILGALFGATTKSNSK